MQSTNTLNNVLVLKRRIGKKIKTAGQLAVLIKALEPYGLYKSKDQKLKVRYGEFELSVNGTIELRGRFN